MDNPLRQADGPPPAGMRFAFAGRCSTEDQQDPESSRAWQLTRAKTLVEPVGGQVVAEFFDTGLSRAMPWQRRPRAGALLKALKDPGRGWDAVVIGEPQRAFYGNQFGNTFPLFVHYRVSLWVPEVGGAIDPDNEAHDLIMSVFAGVSKGERNRIRLRVRTAMAAQTKMEGRFLGGRPPYGYRLADLGPHPNPSKALDGRRLHGLEPDPEAEPVVVRIYAEFLHGRGLHLIAEGLTRDGIPCPSAHDRARNRHRPGLAWSKSAVRVILTNPRYTGRQVWNKQRKDEVLLDVEDVSLGHTTAQRWNPRDRWIVSDRLAHTPIVDDATFEAVQIVLASRGRGPKEHHEHRTRHLYVFRGRIRCALCGRRMQGNWANNAPYYRCSFPEEYALTNNVRHPRNVYLREDVLLPRLDAWLAKVFAPHRLAGTIDAMVTADHDPHAGAAAERARRAITTADRKLAAHRAALEAGADPQVVTAWIRETQADRLKAETDLRIAAHFTPAGAGITRETVERTLAGFRDLTQVVHNADRADKAQIYRQLGLRATYDPGKHHMRIEINLDPHDGEMVSVRGGT